MRFRVNGVNLYVRGSNLIPMEVVEGRANATALHRLVQSAQDANFNMLRVWYAISTCWLLLSLDVCTWWACQHCSHWTYDLPMLSQGRRYLSVLGIL